MADITLRQYLQEIDPTTEVAIGTTGQGGYLYFGSAGNLDEITECFFKSVKSAKRSIEQIKGHHADINNIAKEKIDIKLDYINNYIPPLDRIVVDCYSKEIDECTTIIIGGVEQGNYWFKTEYDKSKLKKEGEKKSSKCTRKTSFKQKIKKFNSIKDVEKYEKMHPDQIFAYLCNGRAGCGGSQETCYKAYCTHTLESEYALNKDSGRQLTFYPVSPGKWMECTEIIGGTVRDGA